MKAKQAKPSQSLELIRKRTYRFLDAAGIKRETVTVVSETFVTAQTQEDFETVCKKLKKFGMKQTVGVDVNDAQVAWFKVRNLKRATMSVSTHSMTGGCVVTMMNPHY